MSDKPKLSIIHRTSHFRGDHAADVGIAIDPRAELVTELVQRLNLAPTDWIEIRVIQEPRRD